MNCFCKTCEDSQSIVIAVPMTYSRELVLLAERKFVIPCPDCAVPIDISLIQAQPVAAE